MKRTGIWANDDFLKLWIGETISIFGSLIGRTSLIFAAVLVLDASALQVGLLAAAHIVPGLTFGFLAGVWVDRSHRRPILIPTKGVLFPGDYLESSDERFTAVMQTDGNFVLYRNGVGALWASGSCGQTVFGSNILGVMQSDGNFVMYPQGSSTTRWATSWPQNQPGCPSNQQTSFGSGHILLMQNDGNLVMYGSGGAKWASNTCCY